MHPSLLPDEYLPLLDELNRIVIASGALLEGNLFYTHHEPQPGRDNFAGYFQNKRHNYALACSLSHYMLEIGLNAGHSALLALANGVEYHGVDICWHAYTRPAAEFLKSEFGDQFHFYDGDSLEVLPRLREEKPWLRFDLMHIDGLHTLEQCQADTQNAIALAMQHAWIIIDDTDMPHIQDYFDACVHSGLLLNEQPEGWHDNLHHKIGRIA